ncbi:class I SAM-dependent methyltransferase, partial [Candidatus Woesearchaeota archaeon]|nr:class I SAM-dependent methyltransferase [Candidatus Woesearchaeota archaeon]
MEVEVFRKIYALQKGGWWFGNARNKLVISLLKDMYADLDKKKLLDVGCSEGAFLDYLKKNKLDFMAIDVDENAINFCKERGFEKNIRYGSILDIPFKENTFDIVTALDVIEHVEDDIRALGEMKRVCKKDGILFLIVPAHKWLWSSNDDAYHHHRRYNIGRIRYIAKECELKILTISHFNILLLPLFVFLTFLKKLFPNKKSSNVLKPLPKPLNKVLSWIMDAEIGIVKRSVQKRKPG